MAQREAGLEVFTGVSVPSRFFLSDAMALEIFPVLAFKCRMHMGVVYSSSGQRWVCYELDGLDDTNGSRAGNLA